MNVQWKISVFNADAQKCYEEISKLDLITPEQVLYAAKNPESELHKCFEWDDKEAANKYRLSQARKVIQLIVVKDENDEPEDIPKRVFQISSETAVYQPIKFFVENKSEYKELLNRAKNELIAFKKRYADIIELEDVIVAIDNLFERGA